MLNGEIVAALGQWEGFLIIVVAIAIDYAIRCLKGSRQGMA